MARTTSDTTSRKLSRRGFLAGATATAAAAATAGALSLNGCGPSTGSSEALTQEVQAQFPGAKVEYLAVDDNQIEPHTDMTNVESVDYLEEVSGFDLPLGSLVHQCSDSRALVVAPGSSSKALIRLGFVLLDSGEFTSVLEQALGAGEDYVIYDARASDSVLAWVECNMVHGLWRVYAVKLQDGTASEELMKNPHFLDEGDGDRTPPQLAVSDTKVYWTVMPDPNGPLSTEDSYLKAAVITSSPANASRTANDAPVDSETEPLEETDAEESSGTTAETATGPAGTPAESYTVYTSHGRMITNPIVSGDVLTFVPRVDTDAVYYQLTTLDLESDEVRNIAILPPSLRVSDAAWLGEGFAFSIEGNYDYAGGLAYFGTYQQLGDERYLYVNKSPVSAPVRIGDLTFVKSTKSVLAINPDYANVAIIDTPQDCVSYGDILAGAGIENRLVLYTTVTSKIGSGSGNCRVRVFNAR